MIAISRFPPARWLLRCLSTYLLCIACGSRNSDNEIVDLDPPLLSQGCKSLMDDVFSKCAPSGEDEEFIECPAPEPQSILNCPELCEGENCLAPSAPQGMPFIDFEVRAPEVNLRMNFHISEGNPAQVFLKNWERWVNARRDAEAGILWLAFSLTEGSVGCYSVIAGVPYVPTTEFLGRYLVTYICPKDVVHASAPLGNVGVFSQ